MGLRVSYPRDMDDEACLPTILMPMRIEIENNYKKIIEITRASL